MLHFYSAYATGSRCHCAVPQERAATFTERVKEAIGLKTTEPVPEVIHLLLKHCLSFLVQILAYFT